MVVLSQNEDFCEKFCRHFLSPKSSVTKSQSIIPNQVLIIQVISTYYEVVSIRNTLTE